MLINYPRAGKLTLDWRGPRQIVGKVNKVVYTVRDLGTGELENIHINRFHAFYPGNLTPEQLKAEAVKQDDYLVECVYDHILDGNEEL